MTRHHSRKAFGEIISRVIFDMGMSEHGTSWVRVHQMKLASFFFLFLLLLLRGNRKRASITLVTTFFARRKPAVKPALWVGEAAGRKLFSRYALSGKNKSVGACEATSLCLSVHSHKLASQSHSVLFHSRRHIVTFHRKPPSNFWM